MKQAYRPWLKLWPDGVIDDDLSPVSFAVFIKMLCLAARSDTPGIVRAARNIAWSEQQLAQLCNVTRSQMRRALAEIEASGKVAFDESGCVSILKWSKYQSDCPSAERVKRFRERQNETPSVTPVVTPSVTDTVTPSLCIQKNRIQSTEPPLVPPEGGAANAAKNIDATFLAELQRLPEFTALTVQAEYAEWTDWRAAKGKRFKDNRAAFRNWLRNAVKFQQRDNGGARPRAGPPPPENDHGAALLAKYGSRT